ncbi:MAG: PQQ-binding-like beta-propeller repeat protein [Fimbriimonas sp.]|nr:PQQ-binding-like beta-propeller repeat protein [Fimbriimonas sp.]
MLLSFALILSSFGQSPRVSQPQSGPNHVTRQSPIHISEAVSRGHRKAYMPGSPWPKFQQNNANSGVGIGGGSNGQTRWSYQTNGSVGYSTPVIGSDGTVYVGSYDHSLYALSPTGGVLWSYQTGASIDTTAALGTDGTIYLSSEDGYLYAIHPNGNLFWRTYTGGPSYWSSPAIDANGMIYVGSSDHNLYAIDSTGVIKWTYLTSPTGPGIESSPAIGSDGTIYVADQPGNLYALSATGQLKWSVKPGGTILIASPAIGPDGSVYVGSADGYLYAVSSNGTVEWSYQTGAMVYSTPAIGSDGSIYFGSSDYYVRALTATGILKWSWYTGNVVSASPCIGADGTIYVGSFNGAFYAFSPTGAINWNVFLGTITAGASIGSDGALYVGSGNSCYAIGTEVNTVAVDTVSVDPTTVPGSTYASGSVALTLAAPSGGAEVSLVSSDPTVTVPPFVIVPSGATTASFSVLTTQVAVPLSATITASSGGSNATAFLTVTPAQIPWPMVHQNALANGVGLAGGSNGIEMWAFTLGAQPNFTSPTVGADGTTYFSAWIIDRWILYAVNPDGTLRWYNRNVDDETSPTIGSDGTLYCVGNQLSAVNADGTTKWAYPILNGSDFVSPATIGADGTIYVTGRFLYAINPNGTLKWAINPTGAAIMVGTPAIDSAGNIYAKEASGDLWSISPTGALNWNLAAGGFGIGPRSSSPAIAPDGTIFVGGPNGNLYAVKPDGTPKWVFPADGPLSATPSVDSIGNVYCVSRDTLYCVSPSGGLLWSYASTGQADSSPIIDSNGTIYAAFSWSASASANGLFAFNPDGSIKWTVQDQSYQIPSQAIGPDGTVYALMSNSLVAIGTSGGKTPISSVVITPNSVIGGSWATGTVTLASPAPATGNAVMLSSSDPSTIVPPGVFVPAGQATADFAVSTNSVMASTPVTVTGTSGSVSALGAFTVNPTLVTSVTLNPSSIPGGGSSAGMVTLNGPAGPSGTTITLSSNLPSLAKAPPTVKVFPGQSSANFSLSAGATATTQIATITASFGASNSSAGLTVTPGGLGTFTCSPSSIVGGDFPTGTITLVAPAPVGGAMVFLSSSDASGMPPGTVTIPAGSSTATFPIPNLGVDSNTSMTLSANLGATTKTCSLTLLPAWVMSVTVSPTSVLGGSAITVTGTINLNGKAGPSGTTVTLTSSNPAAASVPSTATVTGGTAHGTFAVTTYGVSTAQVVTLTATVLGKSSTTTLTVNPAALSSVSVSPSSIVGGDYPTGTVTLSAPAPVGGTVVALSSNSPSLVPPATVTVPSGATSTTFPVPNLGVDANTITTLTATLGPTSKNCTLTLLPAGVLSITVAPTSVVGGSSTTVTGTINLNGKSGPSGTIVNLTSSNSGAASVLATAMVPGGTSHGTFSVTTYSVASAQGVTLTAKAQGTTATTILTVNPPVLTGFTISPPSIVGGDYPTGSVTISAPAPVGGVTVNLSSNSAYVVPPVSVTVLAGATSVSFLVPTKGVDSNTPTTVTATLGAVSKVANLTLLPAGVLSVTVSPTTVVGGSATVVTGTVNLNGKAGPSGLVVTLASSNTGAASVPISVPVPGGTAHGTFTITTHLVGSTQVVTISATGGGLSANTTLTVTP